MPEEVNPPQDTDAQAVAAPEGAVTPEGEGEVGREGQAPDPLAELTFAQVRERFATDFEQETGQRVKEAQNATIGQARKEFAAWHKKAEGEFRDMGTFERLEDMRTSDDMDKQETFRQEMAKPEFAQSYARGQEMLRRRSQAVTPDALRETAVQAEFNTYDNIYAGLCEDPLVKGLGDEQLEKLRTAAESPAHLVTSVFKAAAKAAADKEREAIRLEEHKAAREEVLAELRDKGVGVEEITGGTGGGTVGSAQIRKQYADGNIDTATYESRMKAIGAKP